MAVNLSPVGGVAAQFFTNTGAVLTGGKLFTYLAGTTTPAVAYTSSQGTTAWSNPIVLDAAGRVSGSGEIWLTDGIIYKFVLKDTNDVLIATYDNITGINSNSVAYTNQQQIVTATASQTVFNLSISYQPGTNSLSVFVDGVNQYGPGAQYAYTETDSDTVTFVSGLHVGAQVKFTTTQQQGAGAVNASQVTYNPAGTGAVATNVQAKLRQTVSLADFGAVGDGSTDDTAAIQAAVTASQGKTLIIPPASVNYKVTASINGVSDICIVGCGVGGAIKNYDSSAGSDISIFVFNGKSNFSFENVALIGSNKAIAPSVAQGAGFYILNCSNFKLLNNNITYMSAQGILISSASSGTTADFIVSGNTISNGNAAFGGDDIAILSSSKTWRFVVQNNFCYSNNGSGIGLTQGNATGGQLSDGLVTGNSVENKQRHGIYTYGDQSQAFTPYNITISNNRIVDVGWIGIYINEHGTDIIIDSNQVADAAKNITGSLPWACIGAVATNKDGKRLIVTNNICDGWNGYSGINLVGFHNCVVANNVFLGDGTASAAVTSHAISLQDCYYTTIENNNITLTGVEGGGVVWGYLDSSATYYGCNTKNNIIIEPSYSGVAYTGSTAGTFAYCQIEGNYIDMDNDNDYQIQLENSNNFIIKSNTLINGAGTVADILLTNCDNNLIDGNKLIHNRSTGYSIYLPASTSSGNTITNNDFSGITGLSNLDDYIRNSGTNTTILSNKYKSGALTGSFTCAAAATTVVSNANSNVNMKVTLVPTNAAAATLMATKGLYWSAYSQGSSFTLATGDAASAAGTETFNYYIS